MGAIALEWANISMSNIGRRERDRQYVDFASVPESQWKMHDRLDNNWKRWVHNPERQHVARMFALVRSDYIGKRSYGAETRVPVDRMDGMELAKAVAALPPKHRDALVWYYLENGRKPIVKARALAVSLEDLADLVKVARTMIMNRGV